MSVALAALVGLTVVNHFRPSTADASAVQPDFDVVLVGHGLPEKLSSKAFETVLATAEEHGDRLLVAPLSTTGAASDNMMVKTGEWDLARAADIQAKETATRSQYSTLFKNATTGPAIAGMYSLQQHLTGLGPDRPTHVNVLVSGSVRDVAPGVDLGDVFLRGDPSVVVAAAKRAGLTDCRGWRVHILNGSDNTETGIDAEVKEVWRRVIAACGGALTSWDPSQLMTFPVTTPIDPSPIAPAKPCDAVFRLSGDTLFKTGSPTLLPGAAALVDQLVTELLVTHPNATVIVDGYTDSEGSASLNQTLSVARAKSLALELTQRGVQAGRITIAGHGERDPVGDNHTVTGRALNRRVVATLTEPSCDGTTPLPRSVKH